MASQSLISQITRSTKNYALRSRIIRKWEQPHHQFPEQKTSIELVLMDTQGDTIHATIGVKLLKQYKQLLKELDIIVLQNFIVCPFSRSLKTTNNPLKIVFTNKTSVRVLLEAEFTMNIFNLIPYNQFANVVDIRDNTLCDVIGKIVGHSAVRTHRQGNSTSKFMNVELQDNEDHVLAATFWGDFVDEIEPFLRPAYTKPVVVVMQFIRAQKFHGRYTVRNTYNASKLWVNADLPQKAEFTARLIGTYGEYSQTITQITDLPTVSISEELESEILGVKSIYQLIDYPHKGTSWIVASIVHLEMKDGWSYLACTKCPKKAETHGTQFYCPKCQRTDNTATPRFRVFARVEDKSARTTLLLWDKEVRILLGKTAAELHESFIQVPSSAKRFSYPEELNSLIDVECLFKVSIKPSNGGNHEELFPVLKICEDDELINQYRHKGATENDASTEETPDAADSAAHHDTIDVPASEPATEDDPITQLSGNIKKRVVTKKKII